MSASDERYEKTEIVRRPTGAIPAHWTVPAEVSASAVERPERPAAPPSKPSRLPLYLAGAAVAGGLALGLATGIIPLPEGLFAADTGVAPVVEVPTVVERGGEAGGPGAPSGAASVAPAPPIAAPGEPSAVANPGAAGPDPGAATAAAVPVGSPASPESPAAPVADPGLPDPPAAAATPPEAPAAAPEPPREDPRMVLDELPMRRKANSLIEKGEKLVRRGRYATAIKTLEQAAALDPRYPRVHRALGIAKARKGDVPGARASYERYLELDPNAPDAADVRRILGQ